MSLDPAPGVLVPIPCRVCGHVLMPFTVDWGTHSLNCSECGGTTLVHVRDEKGSVRIRTEAQSSNPGNGAPPVS
ncbi:MAG TPA: hypothetical protein VE981_02515 [Planctomycetota bacterium]|nr:hypothetical protein [Planctomycetota bacterium]